MKRGEKKKKGQMRVGGEGRGGGVRWGESEVCKCQRTNGLVKNLLRIKWVKKRLRRVPNEHRSSRCRQVSFWAQSPGTSCLAYQEYKKNGALFSAENAKFLIRFYKLKEATQHCRTRMQIALAFVVGLRKIRRTISNMFFVCGYKGIFLRWTMDW